MGEGKSEGGPGVDRGGGRGCQPGPGLSSGSLFLPRVSLGAAGDNVALSGAAGGGGTRRTERYRPGAAPAGAGALGAAGRAGGERFPPGQGGGCLLCAPPRPVPCLRPAKVPRTAGGAQRRGCPGARGQGRCPLPITGAEPAAPPLHCLCQRGDTRRLPPDHRQPGPPLPGGVFCPRRVPAAVHPRGDGGPGLAAGRGVTGGYIPPISGCPPSGTGLFPSPASPQLPAMGGVCEDGGSSSARGCKP